MRVPPYRERTRAELRRAMRWAQRALHLKGWTLRMLFDDDAYAYWEGRRDPAGDGGARMFMNTSTCYATIGVWMKPHGPAPYDLLHCVFHEMGHLATWGGGEANGPGIQALWEQGCHRIADLLCRPYQAEGRDRATEPPNH